LIFVCEGAGNSAASPNSIIHDLIFITPDGSTSLNEIQGVVCAGCSSGRSKPFAAALERKAGSLGALLDVEPSHQYDLEGKVADSGAQGQPVTFRPIQIKLSRNNSLGFVREDTYADCPDATTARNLSISVEGVITAKPEDSSSLNEAVYTAQNRILNGRTCLPSAKEAKIAQLTLFQGQTSIVFSSICGD
jgi:hypothetical protein